MSNFKPLPTTPARERDKCARKTAYRSRRIADIRAGQILENRGVALNSYRCPWCKHWHHTSNKPNPEKPVPYHLSAPYGPKLPVGTLRQPCGNAWRLSEPGEPAHKAAAETWADAEFWDGREWRPQPELGAWKQRRA